MGNNEGTYGDSENFLMPGFYLHLLSGLKQLGNGQIKQIPTISISVSFLMYDFSLADIGDPLESTTISDFYRTENLHRKALGAAFQYKMSFPLQKWLHLNPGVTVGGCKTTKPYETDEFTGGESSINILAFFYHVDILVNPFRSLRQIGIKFSWMGHDLIPIGHYVDSFGYENMVGLGLYYGWNKILSTNTLKRRSK